MPFEGNHSDADITWKPSTPTKAGALERFTSGPDYLCEFGSTGLQRLFKHQTPSNTRAKMPVKMALRMKASKFVPAEPLLL